MCVGGSPPKAAAVPETAAVTPPPEETADVPTVDSPGRSERKTAQRVAGAGKSSLRLDLNVPTSNTPAQTSTGLNIPQG